MSERIRRRPCRPDKRGAIALYRLMQRKGWSEYRLSQQSGVAYNTIRSILDEKRRPTMDVQLRLAEALDVLPSEIWEGQPLVARVSTA